VTDFDGKDESKGAKGAVIISEGRGRRKGPSFAVLAVAVNY
jgi:hypothetical protein